MTSVLVTLVLVVVALLIYSLLDSRKRGLSGKEAIVAALSTFFGGVMTLLIAMVAAIIVAIPVVVIYWILFTIIKLAIKPIAIAMLIGGVAIIIVAVIQYIKKRRK